MKINISKIRVTQTTQETQETVEIGQIILFQGTGVVVSENIYDNQDGTVNKTSIMKIDFIDLRTSDTKKVVQSVIKVKSRSKKLRDLAYVIATELNESPEGLYNHVMDRAEEYLKNYKEKKS